MDRSNSEPRLIWPAWHRAAAALERALGWVVMALMALLVLDVLWQVATRYLLARPSSWTDELATMLIIWLALLGSSLALARRAHLGVDFFTNLLPPKGRDLARVAGALLVLFFALMILVYGGLQVVGLTLMTFQVSPALQVKMGHVYAALPLSGLGMACFAFRDLLAAAAQFLDRHASAPAEGPEAA